MLEIQRPIEDFGSYTILATIFHADGDSWQDTSRIQAYTEDEAMQKASKKLRERFPSAAEIRLEVVRESY